MTHDSVECASYQHEQDRPCRQPIQLRSVGDYSRHERKYVGLTSAFMLTIDDGRTGCVRELRCILKNYGMIPLPKYHLLYSSSASSESCLGNTEKVLDKPTEDSSEKVLASSTRASSANKSFAESADRCQLALLSSDSFKGDCIGWFQLVVVSSTRAVIGDLFEEGCIARCQSPKKMQGELYSGESSMAFSIEVSRGSVSRGSF